MSITLDFIRNEIEKQSYEISLHADGERIADELTVSQLEFILSQCKIIEQYPDDPLISQLCQNGEIHIQGIDDCSNGGIDLW